MIREKIKNLIKKATKGAFEIEVEEVHLEYPEEKSHGDYATNVAMAFSKKIKKNPMEIAKLIATSLKKQTAIDDFKKTPLFSKIEVAEPGFINFFISKDYLQKQVEDILKQKEKFGNLKIGKGRKLQVEFISANPTGPLTVGNSRGGPFGDTLGNVLQKAGFKVEKAYYINDYGMQIMTLGHSVLKDSEAKYKGDYIDYLHKRIKEKDPYKAGEKAAKIIIDEMIKKTTDRMGIRYDEWISERKLHRQSFVKKILDILKKKKLLYGKEGAIWFKSSKFSDERDRVLVKKDGWKTYLAGDIALHCYKFQKKKFNKVVNIWGADHTGDVPGLQAGVSAIGHKGKLDVILLQFVTLFEKKEKLKMSKRLGVYVTLGELLNKVGKDVARFFFLQKSANTHLNFDLDLAQKQSERNPVYYVQYAHARIHSILAKSQTQISNFQTGSALKSLNHPSELNLIKQLIRFPEVVEDTARDYQVQRLPKYALDLATYFHQFYRDCRVLTKNDSLTKARLALILATKTVLKETLNLMGISAPEKM